MISNSSFGQETVKTEMYIYDSPVPRFKEKELIKEIKKIYIDCNTYKSFYLKIFISNIGIPSRIETNDSLRKQALWKTISKYDSWIAGRKDFKFTETDYDYAINCKGNKVNINPVFVTKNLKKHEIQHFDFYKGIITESPEKIKPFYSYSLNQIIKDSLNLEITAANRYRAKSRDKKNKIIINSEIFSSDSYVLLFIKEDSTLIRIKKNQNFVYLPSDVNIDFMAIRQKKGLIIYKSFLVTSDIYIDNNWTDSTYKKLIRIFNSW